MRGNISSALQALLDARFIQSLSTLEIAFSNGEVLRWAGGYAEIPGQPPYHGDVLRSGGLRQSLGAAVDLVDVTVQNTDWSHSRRLIASLAETLAPATVGRLHRDHRTGGAWEWRSLLRGVVGSPTTNEGEATYRVISDLAAAGQVGATRLVARPCQWKYKGVECGATVPDPTCDFTFSESTGCAGRQRQFRFSGMIYNIDKVTLILPAPTDPGSGGGGGGPIDDYPDKVPIDYGY